MKPKNDIPWPVMLALIFGVIALAIVGFTSEANAGVIEKTFTTSGGWLEKRWAVVVDLREQTARSKSLHKAKKMCKDDMAFAEKDLSAGRDEAAATLQSWREWRHKENTEANIEMHLEKAKSSLETVTEYLDGFIVSEPQDNCPEDEDEAGQEQGAPPDSGESKGDHVATGHVPGGG